MTDTSNASPPQQPTADEIAGMKWWNTMTEAERAKALEAAGWRSGGTWTPSAADAWALHKSAWVSRRSLMSDNTVRIDLELPSAEALALAQFVKRVTWTEMRACAADEAECYEIRAAIDEVQRALADANYAPR